MRRRLAMMLETRLVRTALRLQFWIVSMMLVCLGTRDAKSVVSLFVLASKMCLGQTS